MLLPAVLLLRRGYIVAVIGRARELVTDGTACRRIAVVMAVPRSTVRGWLARFALLAEALRAHFTRWPWWRAAGCGDAAGASRQVGRHRQPLHVRGRESVVFAGIFG